MTHGLTEKMILQHRELNRLLSSDKATVDTRFQMEVRANLLRHLISYAGAETSCRIASRR